MNPTLFKLGKLSARHDSRTLKIAKYLSLPLPPVSVDWSKAVSGGYQMDGNDTEGDCGFAGIHHHDQTLRANSGKPALDISAQNVIDAYLAFTGGADSGVVLLDVLKKWQSEGFAFLSGNKIGAFGSASIQDISTIKSCIDIFGGLYCGVELPKGWQGENQTWDVPDINFITRLFGGGNGDEWTPGSWGGHCVYICGYDAGGVWVVTWGSLIYCTWAGWKAYFSEAYAIVDADWIADNGKAPVELDIAALMADLASVQ